LTQQQQQHTQATAGGSVSLGPNSIDGGFIDSDSGGEGEGGAPPVAPASTAGGGRRRRVLPGSLAS
jgi:hypothetical protein